MWTWLKSVIDFWRGPPTCPRCRLLRCEAILTECHCAFAHGEDEDISPYKLD